MIEGIIRLDKIESKLKAEVAEMQETADTLRSIALASKQYVEAGNYAAMLTTLTSMRLLTRAVNINIDKINELITAEGWAQNVKGMKKKLTVKKEEGS